MPTRRDFFATSALGLGALPALSATAAASGASGASISQQLAKTDPVAARLYETIRTMPVDDTHCHPISDRDRVMTRDSFIERIALPAFPGPNYFPEGVYDKWHAGDERTRADLDKRYQVGKKLATINNHFAESVFTKFMVKEMASFLGCEPRFEAVMEARNAHQKNYYGYVNSLFRDTNIENAMIDTGYADGLDAAGVRKFSDAIKPTRTRLIARVETIQDDLLKQKLSFPEMRDAFLKRVRDALDGTGNFGDRSYGMKSYLLPAVGVIKPVYDEAAAAKSYEELRAAEAKPFADREVQARQGKTFLEYTLTLALEECLARDMPMQFHAGDGEAPSVILRNQQPYYLEEFVRFDRDGMMRMPKIIPIHAGYPLVSEAAWLSHLYTNCYFELSLMTPFIHQGLVRRYLEIMEAVPLSKILFGSDAYHLPELYWLAARWGKRFLTQALAVYVTEGILSEEEALEGARMILYKNNRAVYNLK
ncbi:amidohydrolase family protein [Steroidobacter sp.]|uniref:amidohydrolase family protein n=1 Tax=Steroidobacter sp. TaxID=1978227 RepID=UPI001A478217|nr:amidohydrolase family protein [Steroidobacter sp.]MBL8269910.1 amidohydrolase family protein [Steroidobacter sp.]